MSNEALLRDIVIDHILEDFCKDCPCIRYESDTGASYCPYGDDPASHECCRSSEFSNIENELDIFFGEYPEQLAGDGIRE